MRFHKLSKKSLGANVLYCGLQGLYGMLQASVLSFASLYLSACGYSGGGIGLLLALGYIAGTLLQPPVAVFADRTVRLTPSRLIALCAGAMLLPGAVLLRLDSAWWIGTAFVVLFAMTLVLQPLINAYVFHLERTGTPVSFGIARGLGSFTYAFASLLLGQWATLTARSISVASLVLLAGMAVLMLAVREKPVPARSQVPSGTREKGTSVFSLISGQRGLLLLMLGSSALFFGSELCACFLYQVVENVGGGSEEMGIMLFVAAMSGGVALWLYDPVRKFLPTRVWLYMAGGLFALRALLVFFAPSAGMLYLAYAVPTDTVLLASSVRYVHEHTPPEDTNKAQSLVTLTMSAGGIASCLLGGLILEKLTVSTSLLMGALFSLLGMLLLLFIRRPKKK